ncbi:unnamed protein product [Euphydryas editha]|uniref:Uncharacterized protein n=1 Tax=Euphydryas editha TaxID=104508 RepID=A0AAU9TVG4_EUPED|nr:unnamed protein product [Euphydryas editha]
MRCIAGSSEVFRWSGCFNEKKIIQQEYFEIRGLVGDTCGRATYRITARPQFHVKLAARGGRATTARSVAPEIVFGRGRAPSEAAPQSPSGSARASASRSNHRLRQRTRARPPERGYERTARLHAARISVARRPRAASGALPARWPPCSGGGAWRCCSWSRSARLPPARSVSARRHRLPPTPPRKMRPRRRLAQPAQVRPPTLQNRRRQRCRPRPIRLRTPILSKGCADVGYQSEGSVAYNLPENSLFALIKIASHPADNKALNTKAQIPF